MRNRLDVLVFCAHAVEQKLYLVQDVSTPTSSMLLHASDIQFGHTRCDLLKNSQSA